MLVLYYLYYLQSPGGLFVLESFCVRIIFCQNRFLSELYCVRTKRCLTLNDSDTKWFWHKMNQIQNNSDTKIILIQNNSDTKWFWHLFVLTKNYSDTMMFLVRFHDFHHKYEKIQTACHFKFHLIFGSIVPRGCNSICRIPVELSIGNKSFAQNLIKIQFVLYIQVVHRASGIDYLNTHTSGTSFRSYYKTQK